MGEGEQKLCLVEPTLELGEETPLQVQMQLLEAMEGGEALAAEVVLEVLVEVVIIVHLVLNQQQMEVAVELEVMEAVAAEAVEAVEVLETFQGQEVQEVLAVLEAVAEAVEMLELLMEMEGKVMVVMVQQEAMAVAGVVAVPLI